MLPIVRRCLGVLAGAIALSCLAACGLIEESKAAARREAAEKPVVEAAERGDLATLTSLLTKDPTLANSFRWTSTHNPLSKYHTQQSWVVRSDTALTVALKARRLDVVELLLSSGADPNLALDSGDAPLDILASGEHRDDTAVALARLLIARGTRLGPRPGQDGVSTTPRPARGSTRRAARAPAPCADRRTPSLCGWAERASRKSNRLV